MSTKYTTDELNNLDAKQLMQIILLQQEQIKALNENFERVLEQLRIANQNRFGRRSEKMDVIDGQLSIFDEAEALSDDSDEPQVEEVVQAYKRKKQKGKRDADLEGLPEEIIPTHAVSVEELNAFYGEGNWKSMPSETYKRLRYEPASWTVEVHTVEVYVGTGGDHQDEFLRGKRPKDLIRNSIVTPSLGAGILNGKYVLALPLYRIEQEFERNGLTLSRQTMANWIISFAKYWIVTVVAILVTFGGIGEIIWWLAHKDTLSDGLKEALAWLKFVIPIGISTFDVFLIGKVFSGLDREKIELKIRKKIEKKYSYLEGVTGLEPGEKG